MIESTENNLLLEKKHFTFHKTESKTQCLHRTRDTNCYICNSGFFANKKETKEIERVQKKTTSWIPKNWELKYKKSFGKLILLPLSLYIEMHNLFLSSAFLLGNYNINFPIGENQNCDDQPITR